jgi:hypothetical protein
MVSAESRKRENLRTIAIYQMGLIVCFLIQFLSVITIVVFTLAFFPVRPDDAIGTHRLAVEIIRSVGLVLLAASVVAMVFAFLLSLKVYSTAMGIFLAMLTLVPCLGLFVLLVVNSRATFVLRQNGHKVGLLGARLSEFKDPLTFGPASPHPDPLPEGEGEA